MDALIGDHFFGHHVGLPERLLGRFLVADLPQEDVIVVLARPMRARRLVLHIFTQHRRVRVQRLERIDERRQFLVVDLHQFDGIGGDVAVLGNDKGHFLALEQHLVVGQHHLHVAGQRRHLVQDRAVPGLPQSASR